MNAVQKTPTYPIDKNQAQSTTTLALRPSAKSKTMTAIGTPKRRQGMLPPPFARVHGQKTASRRFGKG